MLLKEAKQAMRNAGYKLIKENETEETIIQKLTDISKLSKCMAEVARKSIEEGYEIYSDDTTGWWMRNTETRSSIGLHLITDSYRGIYIYLNYQTKDDFKKLKFYSDSSSDEIINKILGWDK